MTAGRTYDAGRQSQGFRSQNHLDAWYVAYDHIKACDECGQPAQAAWLEGDASWQPTETRCPESRRLFALASQVDVQWVTAAELLALQETLSRAYLARMDAANGYLIWPPDGLASELDELASDIAFERHGWLAPVPSA